MSKYLMTVRMTERDRNGEKVTWSQHETPMPLAEALAECRRKDAQAINAAGKAGISVYCSRIIVMHQKLEG